MGAKVSLWLRHGWTGVWNQWVLQTSSNIEHQGSTSPAFREVTSEFKDLSPVLSHSSTRMSQHGYSLPDVSLCRATAPSLGRTTILWPHHRYRHPIRLAVGFHEDLGAGQLGASARQGLDKNAAKEKAATTEASGSCRPSQSCLKIMGINHGKPLFHPNLSRIEFGTLVGTSFKTTQLQYPSHIWQRPPKAIGGSLPPLPWPASSNLMRV